MSETADWFRVIRTAVQETRSVTEDQAYDAGADCARNGATTENCHFRYFGNQRLTQAWERGKAEASPTARGES